MYIYKSQQNWKNLAKILGCTASLDSFIILRYNCHVQQILTALASPCLLCRVKICVHLLNDGLSVPEQSQKKFSMCSEIKFFISPHRPNNKFGVFKVIYLYQASHQPELEIVWQLLCSLPSEDGSFLFNFEGFFVFA